MPLRQASCQLNEDMLGKEEIIHMPGQASIYR